MEQIFGQETSAPPPPPERNSSRTPMVVMNLHVMSGKRHVMRSFSQNGVGRGFLRYLVAISGPDGVILVGTSPIGIVVLMELS